jgi:hypothetical protein
MVETMEPAEMELKLFFLENSLAKRKDLHLRDQCCSVLLPPAQSKTL